MKKNIIVVGCITLSVILLAGIYAWGFIKGKQQVEKVVEKEIEQVIVPEEIDEWTMLQMAIMKTESEFDASSIGATNDIGIFQITPIFVAEANRILGEEKYSHLDAFDIQKSIEMFNVVQDYHNEEKSISKTINVQNPGGGSIGYGKKVYDNIRFIKRMEEARRELLKFAVKEKLKISEE